MFVKQSVPDLQISKLKTSEQGGNQESAENRAGEKRGSEEQRTGEKQRAEAPASRKTTGIRRT